MDLTCGLVDVFADVPLSGNPLAVVEGADGLTDDTMRRIAREFNQAETTFLLKSDRADWKLRSFTASGAEDFGAGHNALGAWLWLGYHGKLVALDTPRTFRQEIGGDVLPISLEMRHGRLHGRMRQAPLRLLPPLGALDPLAEALGLTPDELRPIPHRAPLILVQPILMVRLRDRQTVDRARPSAERLVEVLGPAGAEGCYVYALDGEPARTAYARFFNPTVGLWEDSATGTAAGPLCAYLGVEGLLAGDDLVVEQGSHMGRQSFLHLHLAPDAELTGAGVVVLRGTLQL